MVKSAGIFITIVAVCMFTARGQPKVPQPYSTSLESELRASLFSNYEVLQRPSKTVRVTVSLNLLTINHLDIKAQTLSSTGYFNMGWQDPRLGWKFNTTYSNIRFIFSTETNTWRPAIVVENSVDKLEVINDVHTLIRIVSDGNTVWTPGGVFETNCEADVTYYPLDTQECSIILSTRAYTSNEVSLELTNNPSEDPLNLEHYTENGEWEVISTSTSSESSYRKGDTNSYSRLYYNFTLRRRPLFHIFNTLFPVILMASLIVFVFKLPPESGERVGMSLTVLLAYAVYLTLISESIPKTSLSASVLSTYLSIILMLSALSVIFTIIVLDIYFNHEDDETPPRWLQSFAKVCLVRCAFWKGNTICKSRRHKRPPRNSISPDHSEIESIAGDDVMYDKNNVLSFIGEKNANQRFNNRVVSPSNIQEAFVDDHEEDEVKDYSWKELALILDRFFMYLFIFLICSATASCLVILGTKY